MQELNFPFDKEELKQLAATFLREFPVDEYPDLAEHIAQHAEPSEKHGGAFESGSISSSTASSGSGDAEPRR